MQVGLTGGQWSKRATFPGIIGSDVDGASADVQPMSDPDVARMQAFVAGDEGAFVQLYEAYRDRIVNYTRRMLGDTARAEEAAQDVFLKLYRSRDHYEPRSRFSTYLYRIATNHCINLNMRMAHRMEASDAEPERHAGGPAVGAAVGAGRAPDALEAIARGELRRALGDALAQLPHKQRAALLLVHYEGQSYREAADVVDVSESALKSLVHRARGRMVLLLQPQMAAMTGDAGTGEVRGAL